MGSILFVILALAVVIAVVGVVSFNLVFGTKDERPTTPAISNIISGAITDSDLAALAATPIPLADLRMRNYILVPGLDSQKISVGIECSKFDFGGSSVHCHMVRLWKRVGNQTIWDTDDKSYHLFLTYQQKVMKQECVKELVAEAANKGMRLNKELAWNLLQAIAENSLKIYQSIIDKEDEE